MADDEALFRRPLVDRVEVLAFDAALRRAHWLRRGWTHSSRDTPPVERAAEPQRSELRDSVAEHLFTQGRLDGARLCDLSNVTDVTQVLPRACRV